jgi:hypothetical protein
MKKYSILFIIMLLVSGQKSRAQDSTSVHIDTVAAQIATPTPKIPVTFSASPSLGFTYQGTSKDGDESEDMQWLGQLQAKLGYEGSFFQFNGSLFLQFGQQVSANTHPRNTQDNLQFSLVPSIPVSENLGLRLFLDVTGETQMGKETIDSAQANFLDPLFLYETLFLGHKTHLASEDGNFDLLLIYGAGYAYQQTYTKHFVLAQNRKFIVDENNPLSNVQDQFTVNQGYSGIFELDMTKNLGSNFSFKESFKTVILTKLGFFDNVKNSRVGSLLVSGIAYKFLSIDYTLHLVYDNNISPRRELDQTMVFGFKLDI